MYKFAVCATNKKKKSDEDLAIDVAIEEKKGVMRNINH